MLSRIASRLVTGRIAFLLAGIVDLLVFARDVAGRAARRSGLRRTPDTGCAE